MTDVGTNAPPVDDVTRPWWDATRERRLLLQHCRACGGVQHYPRAVCTGCGSDSELDWVPASGIGIVDSFTVVHRAPDGGPAPYVVARVRLVEGPVLLTNLVDAPDAVPPFDATVELAWRPLADGRNLPVFTVRAVPIDPQGE